MHYRVYSLNAAVLLNALQLGLERVTFFSTVYTNFVETKDLPTKPTRFTAQVTLPTSDDGTLIKIKLIAIHPLAYPKKWHGFSFLNLKGLK